MNVNVIAAVYKIKDGYYTITTTIPIKGGDTWSLQIREKTPGKGLIQELQPFVTGEWVDAELSTVKD